MISVLDFLNNGGSPSFVMKNAAAFFTAEEIGRIVALMNDSLSVRGIVFTLTLNDEDEGLSGISYSHAVAIREDAALTAEVATWVASAGSGRDVTEEADAAAESARRALEWAAYNDQRAILCWVVRGEKGPLFSQN